MTKRTQKAKSVAIAASPTVDQFWADVRNKVAVARREVAEGQTVDGGAAMDQIISELDNADGAPEAR